MTYVVVSSGRLRGLQGWHGLGTGAALPPDRAAFLEKMRPVIADAQRKVDAMLAGDFSWMNVESTLLRNIRNIRQSSRDTLLRYKTLLADLPSRLESALQDASNPMQNITESMDSFFSDFDQRLADVAATQNITMSSEAKVAYRKLVRGAIDTARTVAKETAGAIADELTESPVSTLFILGAVGAGLFLWMKSR